MKVLFVNPATRVHSKPKHVPLGILQLIAVLNRDHPNISVDLFDDNAYRDDQLLEEALQKQFDVVAVGGLITAYSRIKKIVNYVKNISPDSKIVVGGGFFTSMPEQMMRWIPQIDYGCFPPEELIQTRDGLKPIGLIKEGDYVLTHRGRYRRVVKTFIRPYDGYLQKVKTRGSGFFSSPTPEHQFLEATRKEVNWCYKQSNPKMIFTQMQWTRADTIQIGTGLHRSKCERHYLTLPRITEIQDTQEHTWQVRYYHSLVQEKIVANESLMKLFGYYLAEGSIITRYYDKRASGLSFSFGRKDNIKEFFLAADLVYSLSQLGYTPHLTINDGLWIVFVGSVKLAKMMKDELGSGAQNKRVPAWVKLLPPQKLSILLDAYMAGDGTFTKRNECQCSTSSLQLAVDIRDIATKLGYNPSLHKQNGGLHLIRRRNNIVSTANTGPYYTLYWMKKTKRQEILGDRNFLYLLPKDIKKERYCGVVCNLEVEEDNSYCTISHTVHNCQGEAYQSLPKLLKAIQNGEDPSHIKGLVYWWGSRLVDTGHHPLILDLDWLPFPKYEYAPLEVYFQNSSILMSKESMWSRKRIDACFSLGCPFPCGYCWDLGITSDKVKIGRPSLYTSYRHHSPKYIGRYIRYVRDTYRNVEIPSRSDSSIPELEYPVDFISWLDENIVAHDAKTGWTWLREVENELWRQGLIPECVQKGVAHTDDCSGPHYGGTAHAGLIRPQTLKTLKRIGFKYLDYGLESFDNGILKSIGKGSTAELNKKAVEMTLQAGIQPIPNMIIGFPDESWGSIGKMLDAWEETGIVSKPFLATAYPGSKWFTEYRHRILQQYNGDMEQFILDLGDATKVTALLTDRFTPVEMVGVQNILADAAVLGDFRNARRLLTLSQIYGASRFPAISQ